MSERTYHLELPYIFAGQSQIHSTHNESLRALDAIVQLSVASRSSLAPPSSPQTGDRYIIPQGASSWNAPAGSIVAFQDGAWEEYTPRTGWLAYVADEQQLAVFSSTNSEWNLISSSSGGSGPVTQLGINASANLQNRLTVSSDGVLLTHEADDIRLAVNKAAPSDTASLVFQTDYEGRAEFGLTGSDDFKIKVSSDGSQWHDAMIVDRQNGSVSFPNTNSTGGAAFAPAPQCYLTLVGQSLELQPATGLALPLGNTVASLDVNSLPALDAQALSPNTCYFIYCETQSASLVLTADTAAPVPHPGTDLPVRAGQSDSLCVGMAYLDSSGQFVDDAKSRLVVSRWNKRSKSLQCFLPQSQVISTSVHTQVSPVLQLRFIGFGDDVTMCGGSVAVDHFSPGGNVICRLTENGVSNALDEKFATSSSAYAGNTISLIAPIEAVPATLYTISLAARVPTGIGEIYSPTGRDTQLYGSLLG